MSERWQEINAEIRKRHQIPSTSIYLGIMADCFTDACKCIAELETELAQARDEISRLNGLREIDMREWIDLKAKQQPPADSEDEK